MRSGRSVAEDESWGVQCEEGERGREGKEQLSPTRLTHKTGTQSSRAVLEIETPVGKMI